MPINPVRDDRLFVGDITLHYVQWGEQGTPVVCLHGLTANAFCFQAIADVLAPNHQVIAYDLRGRGESDKPTSGYSVPIHAQDLIHVIDALHLERPVIIGHSLGALISLYFAAHHPDKLSRLVLIDAGAPLPWETPAEQPAWLKSAINRLGQPISSYEEYTAQLKQAPHLGPYWNAYMDIYFSHDVQRHPDGSVTARASRTAVLEEGDRYHEAWPAQQWSHVEVPTLLLRAGQGLFTDNDQLLSAEAAADVRQGIARCRYVNYPTLNHYTIIFGVEDEPAQEIRNFIDEDEKESETTLQHEGYILDAENVAEVARQMLHDHLLTRAMGGPLPEPIDVSQVTHVLDVACGSGGWLLDLLEQHPHMHGVGIDISQLMIEYATSLVQSQKITQVQFQVMDVTKPLHFPDNAFDLVNQRMITSFLSTQQWPMLLSECARITRPGGILRLTEGEWAFTTSAALDKLAGYCYLSLTRTGHSFSPNGRTFGTSNVLRLLLRRAGYEEIQCQAHVVEYSAGTEAHESNCQNLLVFHKLVQPFLVQAHIASQEELDELYKQMEEDMQADDFCAVDYFLTVWGRKPKITTM